MGTSSLKLMLVNSEGTVLKAVTKEYDVTYPKPGWSEQNPEIWWTSFEEGIAEILTECDAAAIKGIGVAGQMHSLVLLDENDNIIRPAILWNDGRTAKQTDYLNNVIGKDGLSALTANIAFAGFTAPKLLWLKENEPENFEKISKIMLPKDYITYRLTGVHATDCSDASGMLLLDVKNRRWSEEMLEICSVNATQLPKLYESYEVVGTVKKDICEKYGLTDVSVVAGAGDNAGAAIGTGTTGKNKCNISLGTSGTVFISSDKFSVDENNSLHSFCHSDGGYHLMGCMLSAASCNTWICNKILNTKDYKAEENRITRNKIEHNGVFFLPYLMGERSPINDADAKGLFIGLRADTTREDMYLAVLEGVCFAIRDILEVAKKSGIVINKSSLCGGGAKSGLWCKLLANILDAELMLPLTEEGPGFGAAMLAMVAKGEYSSVEDCCSKLVKTREVIVPDKELVAFYNEKYSKFRKIYPAVKDLYKEI